jgi:hypothetical protein
MVDFMKTPQYWRTVKQSMNPILRQISHKERDDYLYYHGQFSEYRLLSLESEKCQPFVGGFLSLTALSTESLSAQRQNRLSPSAFHDALGFAACGEQTWLQGV